MHGFGTDSFRLQFFVSWCKKRFLLYCDFGFLVQIAIVAYCVFRLLFPFPFLFPFPIPLPLPFHPRFHAGFLGWFRFPLLGRSRGWCRRWSGRSAVGRPDDGRRWPCVGGQLRQISVRPSPRRWKTVLSAGRAGPVEDAPRRGSAQTGAAPVQRKTREKDNRARKIWLEKIGGISTEKSIKYISMPPENLPGSKDARVSPGKFRGE